MKKLFWEIFPKNKEEWEQLGRSLSQSEIAMYILFPLWEATDE